MNFDVRGLPTAKHASEGERERERERVGGGKRGRVISRVKRARGLMLNLISARRKFGRVSSYFLE